jgi:hypothetical protein
MAKTKRVARKSLIEGSGMELALCSYAQQQQKHQLGHPPRVLQERQRKYQVSRQVRKLLRPWAQIMTQPESRIATQSKQCKFEKKNNVNSFSEKKNPNFL